MKKVYKKLIYLILGGLTLLMGFGLWQNNDLVITHSDYEHPDIPQAFNNFKIVHLSDLHNKMFGANQSRLLRQIEKLAPDIIVITGDFIDRRRFNLETAMCLIEGGQSIAPIYYVSGNHEAWSGQYPEIKKQLVEAGVTVMDDTFIDLSRGDHSIKLFGLSDPDFLTSNYLDGTDLENMKTTLNQWSTEEGFKILLSHRPELFDLYSEHDMNLIFSGHAHGGQIRLPFVGGLIAPDQGLFPTYTSGSYHQQDSTLFVSRGLGNSLFPLRVFNRPEIIAVTLKSIQ